MSATVYDVIIVGGGVAGLSLAALLGRSCKSLLLEREPHLASQASGQNAAIHRPLEHDALSVQLATRSRELLRELDLASVLGREGLLLVSRDSGTVASLAGVAAEHGLSHETLSDRALMRRAPWLEGGEVQHGLCLHDGGVLDLRALHRGLAERARQGGSELRTDVRVEQLEVASGSRHVMGVGPAGGEAVRREQASGGRRVTGVVLAGGERLAARRVVLAAGAWSAELARSADVALPLTPMRRHLAQLMGAPSAPPQPVLWRIEDEVYLRKEAGGILASPCDESAWAAETPRLDPAALIALAQKLGRTAPTISGATVQRAWACLRTFAPDRELVVGADPRVVGLYWLSGLGGRGMTVALGAAEILTRAILSPLQAAPYAQLSVARFL